MPKVIKILSLSIFLLNLSAITFAQTTLGTGLLSIAFNEKTVIRFYNNPSDKISAKTLEFFDDKSTNSLNVKNLENHEEWLQPEVLWLDYDALFFRVKAAKDQWFQIIVNNSTGKTYWVKKDNLFAFQTWETFLKDQFSIERLKNSKQV